MLSLIFSVSPLCAFVTLWFNYAFLSDGSTEIADGRLRAAGVAPRFEQAGNVSPSPASQHLSGHRIDQSHPHRKRMRDARRRVLRALRARAGEVAVDGRQKKREPLLK